MSLGSRLIEAGLVTQEQVNKALDMQRQMGGTLGQNLIRLHALSLETLDKFLTPTAPVLRSFDNAAVNAAVVTSIILKMMYVHSLKTAVDIARDIKLPHAIIKNMMQRACERQLLESLGTIDPQNPAEIHYSLASKGRDAATDALDKCSYVGPAPVSLAAFNEVVRSQRITDDRIDETSLRACLKNLVLDEALFGKLGPAVNSGRAVLLYGPSGNGKTALASALRDAFRHTIYMPYAVEVDGQIIRVFDPEIHLALPPEPEDRLRTTSVLTPRIRDERWVPCRRPLALCGGELAMSMLELTYNTTTRIYEAPVQMKAAGGILLLDDLGRQKNHLAEMLNRWIVPLEKGVDYLLLNSGKKFDVPFDGLVIFSTNLNPSEVIDPAILRRVPYKIFVGYPEKERYIKIFQKVCRDNGTEYNAEAVENFIKYFYIDRHKPLASFHPEFLLRHIISKSRYEGRGTVLDYDQLIDASKQIDMNEGVLAATTVT